MHTIYIGAPPYEVWDAMTDAEEALAEVSWEIEDARAGHTKLTIVAPETGSSGWGWILSDLKTLLETGKPLAPE
jgi:hypothetical protein